MTTAVLQAYRFALDPTPTQEAALRSHCGAQRFAFNWGLALVTANPGQRHADTSYGVPVAELTPAVPWARSWSKTSGVAGMLRNRRLARHIAGVGRGEFRR